MTQLIRKSAIPLLAICLLVSGQRLLAQAVYGSIFGTVTDTTGAVVPGATITITDAAKGTSVTAKSNESGEFTVEHLIPDVYDIKIDMTGFKSYETKGLQLYADTAAKISAALTIGNAGGETIEVDADTIPQLKTDRADVSTIFGSKDVEDLPLGGRNFTSLQLLLPGAQLLGWNHAPDENPQGSQQIQVDGQAFGGVAYMLDGTDNQDPILGIIVINPNIDSLSESKISTQNFDAEFGKAVSSVITAQTKSGTNKFHGSAFDYRTSTANLAKDPFSQYPATATTLASVLPPGLKSQFGGSVGGPILKDKIFFFGDYQGARQRVGVTSFSTVPTALTTSSCLSGAGCNLSDYSKLTTIYQPNGTPYPNNTIPNAALSAPALAYLKLLAPYVPNKSSGALAVNDVYQQGGTGIFNSNQWDVRGDYQVSEKIHSFGRFSRFTDILSGNTLFGTGGGPGFGLNGYGGNSKGANDSVALGADVSVNPTLVTDFRLGYYRYNIVDQKFDESTQEASVLGFGGLNIAGNSITNGLPGFQINDPVETQTEWGAGLGINRCNCPLIEREDQFQLVNNWTKAIRNHSIKVGIDLRYARNLRVPSDVDRTGLFTFNQISTASASGSGGLGIASFLLGEPTQYGRYVSTSTNAKEFQKREFFYVQDTWRATNKLTLNLGLRYELYFPEAVNGVGNGALMDVTTGFIHVAGVGGVPSDMGWGAAKNTYNPRIGVAYQIDPKTVIRAGYGRSFDLGVFGSIFGHAVTQNIPVLANQELSGTGNATTYVAPFNLSTGPPAYTFPTVPTDGLLPNPGYGVNTHARPDPLRLPTIDAWNASIQRSITPTLSVTAAYVGNKGTHTLSALDGNNTNPNEAAIFLPAQFSVIGQPIHWDPSVSSTATYSSVFPQFPGISPTGGTSNPTYLSRYYGGKLAACSAPTYAAAAAASVPAGQPSPLANLPAGACGWTQGITYFGDDQDTHFNALQVTAAKQIAKGASFNINYAWQHSVNFTSGYATWDKAPERGPDDSLRQQQLVAYGLYELPFGHDKMFVNHGNTAVNDIIGGWQLSPVLNWSSGLPFSPTVNSCPGLPQGGQGGSNDVPCYAAGNAKALKTHLTGFNTTTHSRTYFNADPTDFSVPQTDQIGDAGRNSVWGPGFFNTDLAVQKHIPIKEGIAVEFRMDAFNVFNHINPNNPDGGNANFVNVLNAGTITNGNGGIGISSPRQLAFLFRVAF
jgi:Carboxypeptidase regulatory-like domain/TonB dependent receptor